MTPKPAAKRKPRRTLPLFLLSALAGCEAELLSAFEDRPLFELRSDTLNGPVWSLLTDATGQTLVLGGPVGGPPLAARWTGSGLEALSVPDASGPARGARRVGDSIWVAGSGFLWSGPPEAMVARETPSDAPQLTDVAVRRGGEAVAVGTESVLVAPPGGPIENVEVPSRPYSAWLEPEGRLWIGADGELLRREAGGPFESESTPGEARIDSLDGPGGVLFGVGRSPTGRGSVLEARPGAALRDLSISAMPALHVVRVSPAGTVWVGGDNGFLARFDGTEWRAFQLPAGHPIYGLLIETENRVWVGGGGTGPGGEGGWFGSFTPSSQQDPRQP